MGARDLRLSELDAQIRSPFASKLVGAMPEPAIIVVSPPNRPDSAKARLAAENVKHPIHTLRAQLHWDLRPLAASLSHQGFRSLDQIRQDDVLIWSLAKPSTQF